MIDAILARIHELQAERTYIHKQLSALLGTSDWDNYAVERLFNQWNGKTERINGLFEAIDIAQNVPVEAVRS